MKRSKRHGRVTILATYLVAGAFLMQLGPCIGMGLNAGVTAFDFSTLLDENERVLGLFAPCGRPNIQYLDADGSQTGVILYAEDDMIWDCPVTLIETGDG